MLVEERLQRILAEVDKNHSVTVSELMERLSVSESTIRRDLNDLDRDGLLIKVHGGAISKNQQYALHDDSVSVRQGLNPDKKKAIGEYAASLIEKDDFIYIDAGTSTSYICDAVNTIDFSVVTNGAEHARKLASKGIRVYLLGGIYKTETEAVVGEEAVESLSKYNFTKAFIGTNGLSIKKGHSTPEANEAMVKKMAIRNSKEVFFLCDDSKLGKISCVSFASIDEGTTIVNKHENKSFKNIKNLVEVG